MMCKLFRRGRGEASGADYLMSDKDASGNQRNPPAEIVRGDPEITKKLISGNRFAQRYTSGVLSWSEGPDSIIPENIEQVIDSFQNMVCAGISKERINWLWVKHQDKGRLELHFVIPNVDLLTGKRFAPYYDRADRALFRSWERLTNATYGFTNPADPALKRSAAIPTYLPSDKKVAIEAINNRLGFLIRAGNIYTRKDVIDELKRLGFEITRMGEDYISIKDKANKKLRLRGAHFEASFQASAKSNTSTDNLHDVGALQIEFNKHFEKRSRYTASRFVELSDSFGDIAPINFIAIKETINEGNTTLDTSITKEDRASAVSAISKFTAATESFARSIEYLVSSARKIVEKFGRSKLMSKY